MTNGKIFRIAVLLSVISGYWCSPALPVGYLNITLAQPQPTPSSEGENLFPRIDAKIVFIPLLRANFFFVYYATSATASAA